MEIIGTQLSSLALNDPIVASDNPDSRILAPVHEGTADTSRAEGRSAISGTVALLPAVASGASAGLRTEGDVPKLIRTEWEDLKRNKCKGRSESDHYIIIYRLINNNVMAIELERKRAVPIKKEEPLLTVEQWKRRQELEVNAECARIMSQNSATAIAMVIDAYSMATKKEKKTLFTKEEVDAYVLGRNSFLVSPVLLGEYSAAAKDIHRRRKEGQQGRQK